MTGRRWVVGSVIGCAVIVCVLIAVVVVKLMGPGSDLQSQDGASAPTPARSAAAAQRPRDEMPACPVTVVAGVSAPCLGHPGLSAEGPMDKPVVLVVWAPWCAPCRQELPIVARFAAAHPEYQVLLVHSGPDNGSAAADYLVDAGIDLPSLVDAEGRVVAALGAPPVVPITVVLRADGSNAGVLAHPATSTGQLTAEVATALGTGGGRHAP